ncbi:SanA/YdcF family protein [Clostridium septicum]|uniref:SanA protein n=1 Tax=Clostridium septicum TaxID=1504 RepID=A0A9N7JL35_CLOSE|nr:ElyC/SanA/YdcF family protein [Clostridium septicum]AYE34375.1 SanA protein [Clostridium septicum]MDU1312563.1 ElyC/SanA/YdcF family protein [Clostridium septicum]QAS59781.1 SanA protein [Clostridium septicum]UEC20983.1 YdcF family protein [Clostridium septicum]USS00968.1 YdcF family protein [Clostridium septicum]
MKKGFLRRIKKSMIIGIMLLIIILVGSMIAIIQNVQGYDKYIVKLEDLPRDIDSIIVLGAGVKNDGEPSDILIDRLETALKIYKEDKSDTFVLTGDHGKEDYNEVRAMKDYIMKHDINEKRVFMDHAGFSTYDSMYRAKEIFKVNKAIIVTNEYHLPRALYIARKLGIEAYGIPSDIREYLFIDSYKTREKLAQLKDFIYVNVLKPKPEFLGDEIPVNSSDGRLTDDEIKL